MVDLGVSSRCGRVAGRTRSAADACSAGRRAVRGPPSPLAAARPAARGGSGSLVHTCRTIESFYRHDDALSTGDRLDCPPVRDAPAVTVQDPSSGSRFALVGQQISMPRPAAIFRRLLAALGDRFAPKHRRRRLGTDGYRKGRRHPVGGWLVNGLNSPCRLYVRRHNRLEPGPVRLWLVVREKRKEVFRDR